MSGEKKVIPFPNLLEQIRAQQVNGVSVDTVTFPQEIAIGGQQKHDLIDALSTILAFKEEARGKISIHSCDIEELCQQLGVELE